MSIIRFSRTVKAPANCLWDAVADYANVANYHPQVKSSSLLSSNAKGIGASRNCVLYDNSSIVEHVTGWEEGKRIRSTTQHAMSPLQEVHSTISIRTNNCQSSIVTLEVEYAVKYGLAGKLMDALLIKRLTMNNLTTTLACLEHYVRTGQTVGNNGDISHMPYVRHVSECLCR